jgi:hypothetical protein
MLGLLRTGGDKESLDAFACTVTLAGLAEFVVDDCAKTEATKNKEAIAQVTHLKGLTFIKVKAVVLIWP